MYWLTAPFQRGPDMAVLSFEVTEPDGTTRQVDAELSLDPSTMTLRETVRLEDAIGSAKAEQLFGGAEVVMTPKLIQAVVWAKLASSVPGLKLDGFDIPLEAFNALEDPGDDGTVVELPMTVKDGTTTSGIVATGTDSGNV